MDIIRGLIDSKKGKICAAGQIANALFLKPRMSAGGDGKVGLCN